MCCLVFVVTMENNNKRCPNFTDDDVKILVSLVKKYSDVIECKKSDTVTWQEKLKTWDAITKELFNITGVNRNAKSLREKYKNLKKVTRKKFADQKNETHKTGGGTPSAINISTMDEELKDILGESVTGLNNDFDSDHVEATCSSFPDLNEEKYEVINFIIEDESNSKLTSLFILNSYVNLE